jgi:hypothetical protein
MACGPHEVRVRNRPIFDPPLPLVESDPVTLLVSDGEPPSLACPADVRVTAAPGAGSATVAYGEAAAADACDPSPAVAFDPPPGTTFAPGRTEVLCTATDASGHAATCSFAVEVLVNAASVRLGAKPEAVVLEGGSRAVAMAARLEAGPSSEGLRWTRALFRNVGPGDASALCREARLFRDADGGGVLDAGDEPLGSAATFAPGTGTLELREPGLDLAPGVPETFFLVLELEVPPAAARGGAWLVLAFLGATIALGFRRGRPDRRWAALAVLLLAMGSLGPSCSDGGSGGKPLDPSALQVRLESATFRGSESGQECDLEGLPVTGWSIRP